MSRRLTSGQKTIRQKANPSPELSYYRRNRDRVIAKMRLRRDMVNAFKNRPCQDCGIAYPSYVMQLDHVRGVKKFRLSLYGLRKIEVIKQELDKCDVVCSNCHAFRTFSRHQTKEDDVLS